MTKHKLIGRPKLSDKEKKKNVTVKLSYDVRKKLDKVENKSQTVEKALRAWFELPW